MTDMNKPVLDQHTFYAGLLLALRAQGREEFDAEGPAFHRAFLKVIERVRADAPVTVQKLHWIDIDPVFGIVPAANEMLLEAEQDQVLALMNPRLRRARFIIDPDEAREELELLVPPSVAAWFATLGSAFHAELPTAS